jgi:hypothetical protein
MSLPSGTNGSTGCRSELFRPSRRSAGGLVWSGIHAKEIFMLRLQGVCADSSLSPLIRRPSMIQAPRGERPAAKVINSRRHLEPRWRPRARQTFGKVLAPPPAFGRSRWMSASRRSAPTRSTRLKRNLVNGFHRAIAARAIRPAASCRFCRGKESVSRALFM